MLIVTPAIRAAMVGAHRQFVSALESCQWLPELALLAGAILAFLAASLPAIPTGFWDRHSPRPVACGALWPTCHFPTLTHFRQDFG